MGCIENRQVSLKMSRNSCILIAAPGLVKIEHELFLFAVLQCYPVTFIRNDGCHLHK